MSSPYRDLFEIPEGTTYLNAAGISPIPRRVREAGEAGVGRKAAPWTLSRASFYDIVEEARDAAAGLIGARPGDIAITGSASYGIATACLNLPLPAGCAVVTIEEEHSSPVYAWLRSAEASGAVHDEIPRPPDHDWTQAILNRLADPNRPRVAVLSLTPVHWNDGARLDLAPIRQAADRVGAALVVDGTQAVGVQPFPLTAIRPDFLVFPTYKWLLGPYGLAFLYADPARQAGVPLEEHTFSRLGADTITDRFDRELRFMDGARRYDMGERSNFVTLPMAVQGITLLREVGPAGIEAYLRPSRRGSSRARRPWASRRPPPPAARPTSWACVGRTRIPPPWWRASRSGRSMSPPATARSASRRTSTTTRPTSSVSWRGSAPSPEAAGERPQFVRSGLPRKASMAVWSAEGPSSANASVHRPATAPERGAATPWWRARSSAVRRSLAISAREKPDV